MARRRRPAKKQSPGWTQWALIGGGLLILAGIALFALQSRSSAPTATATATSIAAATASPTIVPPDNPVSPVPTPQVTQYGYRVKNILPHDRGAFTQGLVFEDGNFYEGTGLYGRSSLRKVTPDTGEVIEKRLLPPNLFGEGITIWGDNIVQLTWKSHKGFVYDKNTFDLKKEFSYPTEGWGITHDDHQLIMSDGTANLYFWDPDTLAEIGRVEVRDGDTPVVRLNELEYIDGAVYANIWQTNRIAHINPKTGQVTGWIDLSGLLSAEDMAQSVDVLNGIALDTAGNRLFVTGKLWPKIFEIELVPQND